MNVKTWTRLKAKQLRRLPMELAIRGLARWEPLDDPADGYTIVIACMNRLAPMAVANLQVLSRQDRAHLHELILVFDCPVDQVPQSVRDAVAAHPDRDRIRILGYDAKQARVAKRINWGWVYSWLSWSLAISQARTRAVIIHDLDALPVRRDFFEHLYLTWRETGSYFCSGRHYKGNGVTREMELHTTFELILDAVHLRSRFKPFDAFNKLRMIDGRIVDFDTLLYVQYQTPERALRPINETDLMHPSQVICQHSELVAGRTNFQGRTHFLVVVPYYFYLGNDPEPLRKMTAELQDPNARSVDLGGKTLCIDGITPAHWAWVEKQIRRFEQGLFGATRPEIAAFLAPMAQRAGDARSVGRETDQLAVQER